MTGSASTIEAMQSPVIPRDAHNPWYQRPAEPLEGEALLQVDAWWRAANYLSVGQIYLLDNPLL